ncbi:MAG: diacylglycerol/lipid kinase family protein [Propionibacteriaceae bacterium]
MKTICIHRPGRWLSDRPRTFMYAWRGNLTVIPGARANDGVLDLYIASPRRFRHWIKLAWRLVTRQPKRDEQVDQHSGKRMGIKIDGKDNYQLDGDIVGQSTTLTAEIQPGALTVCAPASAPPAPQQ